MINYRFATEEDREKIYEFALQAIKYSQIPEFAKDAGENLQERVSTEDPNNVILAIDTNQENNVVGYIEVDPTSKEKSKFILIKGIYVLPEYRRKGVGKKLLTMMKEEKCGHNEQLRVQAFTESGLRFWENFGFKIHHYSLYYNPKK